MILSPPKVAPSPKQIESILTSTHSWNIWSGPVSSGKTWSTNLRVDEYIQTTVPKNALFTMIGRTADNLYKNVIREILLNDEARGTHHYEYTGSPQRLTYKPKNIRISCAGADNESSWKNVQGNTTAGALFDEMTTLPESLIQTVGKGCRHEGKVWCKFGTTNPDHPSHYVMTNYIQNKDLDIINFFFQMSDNPVLTAELIKETRALYHGNMFERMILGKWVTMDGAIYDKFSRATHVIKDYPKEIVTDYFLGIDWGYEHPLAIGLFAYDADGSYYLIDELYLKHQHIDHTLVQIMKDRGWFNIQHTHTVKQPSYAYADSARPEYIDMFTKLTGITTLMARKQVDEGIQLVGQFLNIGDSGKPRFYILEGCHNAIREMETYHWKKTRDGTKQEPEKTNDDMVDAIRYTLFTRETGQARHLKISPFKDLLNDW